LRLERKALPFIAWSVEREASLYALLYTSRCQTSPDQRILWSDCCEKCIMSSPGSLLVFCTAWKQDTFGAYDQSTTFAQPAVQRARWS